MADKNVSVTALRLHTHEGHEYHEGDAYEVAADQVELLVVQAMAKPTDEAPAAPAKASKPVEPITTEDFGVKPQPHAKATKAV